MLVIHGDSDASISRKEAEALASWANGSLEIIAHADHVFGAKHPWKEPILPKPLHEVCKKTLAFLKV